MSDLGHVTRCYSVRFERTSRHSAARLWRAITDPSELSTWMTYPARVDLRVGGDYVVDFTRTDGSQLDGVIFKFEPDRLLRYAWGTSVVEWEIEDTCEGCRFAFSHYGLVDRGLPDEEGLLAGWHAWLDDLESFAETGQSRPAAQTDAVWRQLCGRYRPVLAEVLGGFRSDEAATSPAPARDRA